MGKQILHISSLFVLLSAIFACSEQKEHTAPAVRERDSVAFMTTYGINMHISDSGVIKYRVIAEECFNNQNVHPPRTIFDKGVFLTQFDEQYHVQAYIQADTAYNYEDQKLWELRGRVRILTKDGIKYRGEELYWDQMRHEYYSHKYSYMETPERTLEGNFFRSDENMRKYYVYNTRGSFEKADIVGEDTTSKQADTLNIYQRPPQTPHPHR